MKPIQLLLLAGCIAAAPVHALETTASPNDVTITVTKKKLEVIFTRQMQKKDLEAIAADLKKQGIRIEYTNITYDASGHVKGLRIKVDCNDGFKGSAGTSNLGKKFGFIRDYGNAKAPFSIGNL
jgi:hypothetical protein